jgi:hypothetical protein
MTATPYHTHPGYATRICSRTFVELLMWGPDPTDNQGSRPHSEEGRVSTETQSTRRFDRI